MSYIVWAQNASTGSMYAPDTAKQKKGWVAEQPAYQYMNWLQNRTDTRLTELEQPWTYRAIVDDDHDTLLEGDEYTVPQYYTGTDSVLVFIGGVLAAKGDSYEEVGATDGVLSTSISWNQDIDSEIPIAIYVREFSDETAITVSVEDLEQTIVDTVTEKFGIDEVSE